MAQNWQQQKSNIHTDIPHPTDITAIYIRLGQIGMFYS